MEYDKHKCQNNIFLCNFGGPETPEEVQPFLQKLFEDPFIIRAPLGPLRKPLASRIAKKRSPQSTEDYRSIGFSPINKYTVTQAKLLEDLLKKTHENSKVMVVNRYTAPFAQDVVKNADLKNARNYILSLYPHLSHSTTVSSFRDFDLAVESVYGNRDFTSSRIFSWWHNPKYLQLVKEDLNKVIQTAISDGHKKLNILFSAHGLPVKYYNKGDPYVDEIKAHFDHIKRLCIPDISGDIDHHWSLSFQSRVGPVEWVKPYTEETVIELAKSRGGALIMVPVSFTSDHIETLYEMDVMYKEDTIKAGMDAYYRVLAPNEDPRFTECLADVLYQAGF